MPTVIKAADSKIGTGVQFQAAATVADKFTLDADAFLISTDKFAAGFVGPAAWTATINGQILSKGPATFGVGAALFFSDSASSKLVIGAEGSIGSEQGFGILNLGVGSSLAVTNAGDVSGVIAVAYIGGTSPNSVTNTGTITAHKNALGDGGVAIAFGGSNDTVTNSGTINGDIGFGDGSNKLVNSNIIFTQPTLGQPVGFIRFGSGADSFDNAVKGFVLNTVELGDGSNIFKNAGLVGSEIAFVTAGDDVGVVGGSGADTFTNAKTGFILGGVDAGGGINSLTNAGIIDSTTHNATGFSYHGGEDADAVVNSAGATFRGRVELGGGANSLTNAGTIGSESELIEGVIVTGGSGIDKVTNSGKMFGNVDLFGGNDVFTNTGDVVGFIDMGSGDDKFTGGAKIEFVVDGSGADIYSLGGGDDQFIAFGGEANPDSTDTVDGGAGLDSYSAIDSVGIVINLDTVSHQSSGFALPTLNALAGIASTQFGIDKVKGFEVIFGSGVADVIMGAASIDHLNGNGGADELWGFAGNDFLGGGGEDDFLVGGAGGDQLSGDSGSDRFVYTALADSGLTRATRDTITDFEDGFDIIDLSRLDANTKTAINDSFNFFIGPESGGTFAATGVPGQLQVIQTATGFRILGEVTGDGKADFSINVTDEDHSTVWSESDFIL